MKKFLFVSFFLIVSIGVLYGSLSVFAAQQKSTINPFGGTDMESPITSVVGSSDGGSNALTLTMTIIRWMYTILFIVAVAVILLAAYNFARGGSNEKLIEVAKKQLKWAVVGIAVALMATGVTWFVKNALEPQVDNLQPKTDIPTLDYPLPSTTEPLNPVPEDVSKPVL
jgi:hypothetical protein